MGQEVVGQDVTGAISLGQNIVGQEVSGAGRRGAELRGAGRRWGKISGAGGHGAEGSGAGSGSPFENLEKMRESGFRKKIRQQFGILVNFDFSQ